MFSSSSECNTVPYDRLFLETNLYYKAQFKENCVVARCQSYCDSKQV